MQEEPLYLKEFNLALSEKDTRKMLQITEKVLNDESVSNKDKGQLLFIFGCYFIDINDKEKAIITLSKALSYDDMNHNAYIRKIEALISLERIEEAIQCCKEGIKVFPKDEKLLEIKKTLKSLKKGQSDNEMDNDDLGTTKNINLEYDMDDFEEDDEDDEDLEKYDKNKVIIIAASIIAAFIIIGTSSYFIYKKFFIAKPDVVADSKVAQNAESDLSNGGNKSGVESEKYLINNEKPNDPFSGKLASEKDFIFKDSDKSKLTYDDLINKTLDELFIGRNEIFARHGYVYTQKPKLNEYFKDKSWYVPNSKGKEKGYNDIELYNANLIKQVEVVRIAHYNYGNEVIKDFVIADSDKRKLTENDIKNLKDWELIIAKNEIYARHGLKFEMPQISDHFKNQDWYKVDENWSVNKLSKLESSNVNVIAKEESARYLKILNR